MWSPKVSIVIPVYNGANYMKEAIDSALNQTYKNLEVIVVNDGSTDNGETDLIAKSYGDRIKYICKENGGVSSALNVGVREMTGEYFSWLSHDDVYFPNKIQNQVDSLSSFCDEKIIGLCSDCFIDDSSNRLNKQSPKRYKDGKYSWDYSLMEMLRNGTFSGCALLIPKKAFDECGLFHEGLRFSQDALMWMKILMAKYSLVYNSEEDVCSRIHGKQLTQTGRGLFQKDSLAIGKEVIPDFALISNKKNNFLYQFAYRNAKNGNKAVVDECIKVGRSLKLVNFKQILILRLQLIYGNIRPFLRKLYYKTMVKAIKTK